MAQDPATVSGRAETGRRPLNSETTQFPLQCFLVFTVSFEQLFLYFSESKKEFSVRDRFHQLGLVLGARAGPWGSLIAWLGSKLPL